MMSPSRTIPKGRSDCGSFEDGVSMQDSEKKNSILQGEQTRKMPLPSEYDSLFPFGFQEFCLICWILCMELILAYFVNEVDFLDRDNRRTIKITTVHTELLIKFNFKIPQSNLARGKRVCDTYYKLSCFIWIQNYLHIKYSVDSFSVFQEKGFIESDCDSLTKS